MNICLAGKSRKRAFTGRKQEANMSGRFSKGAVALSLLLVGVAPASAELTTADTAPAETYSQCARLRLNHAQEAFILQSLMKEKVKVQAAPSSFKAEVGQRAPTSISLEHFPKRITERVWAVGPYGYAMLNDQLWVVDLRDRIIDDIIAP
jgi:hypothetical protein